MRQNYDDAQGKIVVGSDGSYKVKGQGTSAFVMQMQGATVHSEAHMVVAHSSYDAEIKAASLAIEYLVGHHTGRILFFIDNQSTIKSLFNTKPHSAFELSKANCQALGAWLTASPLNHIEICWMPSHLGFQINEMADALADQKVVGPAPFPAHNIASRIRHNRSLAVQEWRTEWQRFADSKVLTLKKKRKPILPHAWDSNGKQFIKMAGNIVTYSRFIRLVSGHAPTGEYRAHFFPNEPRGCTCFSDYQTRSHLLVECPKYSKKFSSMFFFHVANNNVHKIFAYLKDNPTAFTFEDEPIDIYDPP